MPSAHALHAVAVATGEVHDVAVARVVVQCVEHFAELARAEHHRFTGQLKQALLADAEPVRKVVGKFRVITCEGLKQVEE